MRSMTGFGVGESALRGGRLSVEVRSLNHRFSDLRVRLPQAIADHTFFVEQICRARLGRGRFDLSVRVDGATLPPIQLDVERARAAYESLAQLRDEIAPGSELPLSVLVSLPDLFVNGDASSDPGPLRTALQSAVGKALDHLDGARSAEGAALHRDLSERLEAARELQSQVARKAPALTQAHEERLVQRLRRLERGVDALDPARIATEVALLADRADVTEELVRLRSHFDQFAELLDASGPTGRKMDFFLQEMARETNTIAAKCQDAALAAVIVSLKAEVERLREQVQNVE